MLKINFLQNFNSFHPKWEKVKDGAKARVKEEAKQRQDNGKMDCLGASTVAETVSNHSDSIIGLLSFLKRK